VKLFIFAIVKDLWIGAGWSFYITIGGMKKKRLDVLLFEKGLVESRSQAQRLVMAGQVKVNSQTIYKPATMLQEDAEISVIQLPKYVSRGAEKLEAALSAFHLMDLSGKVCADVGASTGGFTDCLLSFGAERVYAIDVGQNILHWKLRNDDRVTVMEKTNVRYLENLPEKIDLITIDVSFISLEIVLPVVRNWLKVDGGNIIALIKPQFEAGRKEAARGKGVIRDSRVHRKVLQKILGFAISRNFSIVNLIPSPILGPKGNTEFLVFLDFPGKGEEEINHLVDRALDMAKVLKNS
jgi:23S rRNA (cytidine1920-2'-O)/16S rRNA (cytidine1409-2'-O)-methyltransferase